MRIRRFNISTFVIVATIIAFALGTIAATAQPAQSTASAKKKKQVIGPSFAWQISDPLGLQSPAEIDTSFVNYHATTVPSLASIAWATTGNFGAMGQNQIFMDRQATSDFFMADAISTYTPTISSQRYFNTRIPMTIVSYTTGGNKYSNQDRTQALFSGNITPKLEAGAAMDYIYSKGSYDYQADKDFTWRLFSSYIGDRYELQTFFNNYNFLAKENGGITDDRYITDPAAVQGGETKVDNKSIPTRLNGAHSKITGTEFFMNHRYKVGYYKYQRDTLTDTIIGKTYIPVTSFIWTMDFKKMKHRFINTNGNQDTTFFENTYLGLGGTDEFTTFTRLRNTLGVSLLEGFNKYAKFGFAIYATHEMRRFVQVVDSVSGTELPEGLDVLPVTIDAKKTQHMLWVGGQMTKQKGSLLTYDINAKFGVMGDVAGDIDVSGRIATRFPLLGDSVTIRAFGHLKNREAPYLLKRFISNHFAWSNDFSKEQRLRLGGTLVIPHTGTSFTAAYETLKNHIFFNTMALPEQHSSAVHILNLTLDQRLHFRALHWDNRITYQTTSNDEVIALPALALYSNLYAQFMVAKVLHVQIGIDCNYYTRYYAPNYNPATMTFYNQRDEKCGNFIFANAYANFRLKQANFFVLYTHVNKGIVGKNNYFSIPHYPLNPGRFQFGVSVNFIN